MAWRCRKYDIHLLQAFKIFPIVNFPEKTGFGIFFRDVAKYVSALVSALVVGTLHIKPLGQQLVCGYALESLLLETVTTYPRAAEKTYVSPSAAAWLIIFDGF